jgi:hypothetical protein
MAFIDSVKEALPDYAKDTKLNLDAVLLRSTLDADVAMGCAGAALAATGNGKILSVILADTPVHAESAMTAASIMAQNNVWYPYVEMADDPALKGLPAGAALRATFIVDPDNVIQHVTVNNLNVGRNPEETLRVLDALQTGELCACNRTVGGETL